MKIHGIFNELDSYRLLRFSNFPQTGREYSVSNYPAPGETQIKEVCIADIDYDESKIGKTYDLNTNTFID
jgi:hypothetical protein